MFHNQNLEFASLSTERQQKCIQHVFLSHDNTYSVAENWMVGPVYATRCYSNYSWTSPMKKYCVYKYWYRLFYSLIPHTPFCCPKYSLVINPLMKRVPNKRTMSSCCRSIFHKLQQPAVWENYWAFFKRAMIPFFSRNQWAWSWDESCMLAPRRWAR